MKIGNHEIERAVVLGEQDWLERRASFIGSSDAAALFGLGYGETPSVWSLWAEKTGAVAEERGDEDERMMWGKLLERPILEAVRRRTGWDVLYPMADETLDGQGDRLLIPAPAPIKGMAATCDAFVHDHDDGLGLIEVKNRDWLQWREDYTDDDASARDQIQLAQQMICVPEAEWGVIAVLVSGNDLKLYHYTREQMAMQMADIRTEVQVFWKMIDCDIEPGMLSEKEMPSWGRVHRDDPVRQGPVDVPADDIKRFENAAEAYYRADPMAKALEKEAKKAKATLVGLAAKHDGLKSEYFLASFKYSPTNETTVALGKDENSALLDIAGDPDNGLREADRLILGVITNWSHVTRRAGTTIKLEVEVLKKRDIVEDIGKAELGG